MRSLLCASLVLVFASAASAQFANNPAFTKKPAGTERAKKGDKPADPSTIAVVPPGAPAGADAADAPAVAPNALFAALDLDGDGVISKIELRKAMASLKKLDLDNDGNITLAECGGGAAVAGGGAVAGNDANQWIDRIMAKDKNNDGKLTPDELTVGERQMLQGADLNNDGAIDRQELAAMGNRANAAGGQNGNYAAGANGGVAAGRRNNEAMGRFLQWDRNHDGRLTADEVPPQAMGALRGADTNGDGAIDAGEMQAVIAQMGDRAKAFAAGADPNAAGANRKRPPRN
jgi:Ca2+-binding EF-hand superfamily protein